MRSCICGKPLLPRRKKKGGREKEYCCDTCRQRAYRARNKDKHNLARIIQKAHEREWNAIEQHIHRETWQDELEHNKQLIAHLLEELTFRADINKALLQQIESLENKLADKEAEIVRLNVLLEGQAKRKRS